MRNSIRLLAAAAIVLGPVAAFAGDVPGARVLVKGSQVIASMGASFTGTTLSISGPDGFHAQTYSKGGTAEINLIQAGATGSGQYTYQVSAASPKKTVNKNPLDNGRGGPDKGEQNVPVSLSGSFYAQGGLVADRSSQAEPNN